MKIMPPQRGQVPSEVDNYFSELFKWRSPFTKEVTADTTLSPNDKIVRADATSGAITITFPEALLWEGETIIVYVADNSGNGVTLDGAGAETINGAATFAMTAQYSCVEVLSTKGELVIV